MAGIVVQAADPRDQTADHRKDVGHSLPPAPGPASDKSETVRQRFDHHETSTAGVGEVLDVEMDRIADHPLGELGRQQRLEGAVLVDGDLVAEGQQPRGDEDGNHRGLHADRGRHERGTDVVQADAPVPGALELAHQDFPRGFHGRVRGRPERHGLAAPTSGVQPGPQQERPVHGGLGPVALEPQIGNVCVASLDHGFQQQAPRLGPLRGQFAAVEHLVADGRRARVSDVSGRRHRGTAPSGRKLGQAIGVVVAPQQDPTARLRAEGAGQSVIEGDPGLRQTLTQLAPRHPVAGHGRVVEHHSHRSHLPGRGVDGRHVLRNGRDHGLDPGC